MGKLDGKIAIVTGASRGIGKATALLFAKEGAKVVCAARTMSEGEHMLEGSLSSTVAEIKKARGMALAVATDVSDEESCMHLLETAKKEFGPVDVLVNDAALSYFIPIKDYPTKRWFRAFSVNVHGPFMLSKLVLPDMIARHRGAIVNVSSGAAIGPGRGPYTATGGGGTMYGATKAALERFSQGLAEEVYQYGITVACVSPSLVVPTPGTVYHKLVTGYDDPRGEPPEMMARAILLLATEPLDKVGGRVTYSQAILKEFGWIKQGKGLGIDRPGSGYSQAGAGLPFSR
ncbi:MAG: SDR family NAD(P)-dependent oxidoreductase [Dehalococcoidales bacterium]|nr:SDR family NAD(P)-dependent oxidoreductase [Dehalococcoidales bacterium]